MTDIGLFVGRKIRTRLVIPCAAFLLVSSIDRANVSFAALAMNRDLGLSSSQYGFGAGIFFVGYLLAQYPSVMLFRRWGMAKWLSLLTIVWGIAASSMAFIETANGLYVLRIILGLAEGGLASGIMLYLADWAAERDRASILAIPIAAIPMSLILGAPLSGLLLGSTNSFGLESWRWMFLAEGLPAIAMAAFAFFYFPRNAGAATWLTPQEKYWLSANVSPTPVEKFGGQSPAKQLFASKSLWLCALIWFCILSGNYGVIFWLPQAIRGVADLTPVEIGGLVALPWIANVIAIGVNARLSDNSGERFYHLAIPAVVAAGGLAGASVMGATPWGLAALVIAGGGLGAALAPVWAIPIRLLPPEQRTTGIVAINLIGSTSGLIIPVLMGVLKEKTGSFGAATLLLIVLLIVAALAALHARSLRLPDQADSGGKPALDPVLDAQV